MGLPIIQAPTDIWAVHELIWKVKPDIIIECGVARGGSVVWSASQLIQLDLCEAISMNKEYNIKNSRRKVVAIDVDIRAHNRKAIEDNPYSSIVHLIEGSSTDREVFLRCKDLIDSQSVVMVILDSDHTHSHVLQELELYGPLVSKDSYCIVFDTIIDDMPGNHSNNREWSPENNPKTAVHEFLSRNKDFQIDDLIHQKLLLTSAPDGFLHKIN